MSVFSYDMKKMECFDNSIIREYGFYLPCFNCRSIKKCDILVDGFNNENFRMRGPHIKCKTCKTMLSNARYDDHEDYNIIYKKVCKKIDKRFTKILYKLHEYSSYDEICNLSNNEINIVCNILKLLLYNHINLYGDKKRMISINYLLMRLFDFLGLDLGLEMPVSNRYDEYFDNIMEYSFETIRDLLGDSL